MSAKARVQVNLAVSQVVDIKQVATFPDIIFPIIWFEEVGKHVFCFLIILGVHPAVSKVPILHNCGYLPCTFQGSSMHFIIFYFIGPGIFAEGNDQPDGPGHYSTSHRQGDHIGHPVRTGRRAAGDCDMAAGQGGQQAKLSASRARPHHSDQ